MNSVRRNVIEPGVFAKHSESSRRRGQHQQRYSAAFPHVPDLSIQRSARWRACPFDCLVLLLLAVLKGLCTLSPVVNSLDKVTINSVSHP